MELELDFTKTSIIHAATDRAFFLGTFILKATVQKNKIIRNAREVRLEASIQKVVNKLKEANFVKKGKSYPKFTWYHNFLRQIINLYNSVLKK